ncbi:MAG: hypothetical protein ACTHW2_11020 [Tissierella sp.]|uniref:hypothetical protein n=1 Tax=Tissierella sp. TaxID=41274 RepID=UPI003F94ADB1
MKKILIFVLLICSTIFVVSCSREKYMQEMTLLDSIKEISISEFNGYGGLNEDYIASVSKKELISDFENIIRNTSDGSKYIDKEGPDYDILIKYEDGGTHGLHLILGDKDQESKFLYIGHENIAYSSTQEATEELKDILNLL